MAKTKAELDAVEVYVMVQVKVSGTKWRTTHNLGAGDVTASHLQNSVRAAVLKEMARRGFPQ